MDKKGVADLLSEEELKMLAGEFKRRDSSEDRYFLLRIHAVVIMALSYVALLIFFPQIMVDWFNPQTITYEYDASVEGVLFARGLLIIFGIFAAIYSYKSDKNMPLVFGSIAIIAILNLVMDFSIFYWERFFEAPFMIAYMISIGMIVILLLISIYRNIDRIPEGPRALFKNPFRLSQ